MILTCSECKAQYTVPTDAIKESGRKVRCIKCSHVWHQKPLAEIADTSKIEPTPQKTEPIPEHSNLPAEVRVVKAGLGLKISFALLLITALFNGVIYKKSFPDSFGQVDTSGLAFNKFSAEKIKGDAGWNFDLVIDVTNEASEVRPMPEIFISVLSKGGNLMDNFTLEPDIDELESGESFTIERVLENVSGNADKIIFDIGNEWELYFR